MSNRSFLPPTAQYTQLYFQDPRGGGSGTAWWLTCEIMWLFKGGCCWGVGGRAGSCGCGGCCGCCWAVQGRRPRTDWDEVTGLHTSGAPSAIPKAKRRPTKSCKHQPWSCHPWRCRALLLPCCFSSLPFCPFPHCLGKIRSWALMHFSCPADGSPHLSRFLLPRDSKYLAHRCWISELNEMWGCQGTSPEGARICPSWLDSWKHERCRFLIPW